MKSIKENRGITLIALAVTIVVILILAGVTISVTLGENGIINKAKEAAEKINNLVKEDETELNDLLEELNETMNSEWNSNIEIPEENIIPDPDPEPDLPTNIEDVTEIQEETVQVEDEYGNKVTVPKGFEVVEEEGTTVPEGIVVQDKDGNQFVWIPVGRVYKDNTGTNYSDIQLGRYTFNKSNGTPKLKQAAYTEENPENYKQEIKLRPEGEDYDCIEYATRANPDGIASNGLDGLNAIAKNLGAFVDSVKRNSGYYMARYEASYGSGSSVADYKPLSKVSTSKNFSTSKVGSLWNTTTQLDAAKIARNMYNNDNNVGVESDLTNSYAWDTAIVFIQAMGNRNYANKASVNSSLANTGTTGDEVCNINDMASNCREWSTEYSTSKNSGTAFSHVYRGGVYSTSYGFTYVAQRNAGNISYKYGIYSFRPILYAK